jgi:hypothetical protein
MADLDDLDLLALPEINSAYQHERPDQPKSVVRHVNSLYI